MSNAETEVLPFLNRKEFTAAEYFLRLKNQREAYKKAGYKGNPKTVDQAASKFFRQVKVAKYISMREAELNLRTKAKTGIDRNWVIDNYKEIHDRCMQKVPVVDGFGNQKTTWADQGGGMMKPEGIWSFNAKGAVSALDGISRVMGFNAPVKLDATLRHVQLKEIATLPASELIELAQMQTVSERQN